MGHPSLYVISSCVGNGRAIRPVAGLTIAKSAPVISVTLPGFAAFWAAIVKFYLLSG